MRQQIADFLAGETFAVVGASVNRTKFGNRVLRRYIAKGYTVYPINPSEPEVEGVVAYDSLAGLPEPLHGISIVTPPSITEQFVNDAAELHIPRIWIQPGAESAAAIDLCVAKGISVIAGGPCLLVELG